MDNNKEVISLLQKYELPLFFSGHLHVQRIRKHKSEPGVPEGTYGIQEIVTDALSIPPCQYGEVLWEEDGSISYATRLWMYLPGHRKTEAPIRTCWILKTGPTGTYKS